MADTTGSGDTNSDISKSRTQPVGTIGAVGETKGETHEPASGSEEETAVDKAARITAKATVWIATFTVILAIVGIITLIVVILGGADTAKLAQAAVDQASSMKLQEQHAETMNTITRAQAAAALEQAARTKDLAEQAIIQANAAKSAAQTASDTLHVSERAYVDVGALQLNMNLKMVTIPILNAGRIPSGRLEIVAHESTDDVPDIYTHANLFEALERHWQCSAFQAIPPGPGFSLVIPIVKMDPDKLKTGLQTIIIAGFMSYNDGFDATRQVTQPFCIQSLLSLKTTELSLSPCDPVDLIPKLELADGYPNNEQSNEPQRPN